MPRYRRPALPQPDPAKILVYLRDARPTTDERHADPKGDERRRVAAVKALHALWRRWRAEAKAAEAAARACAGEPLPPGSLPEVVAHRAQAETAAVADAIERRRKYWETPREKGGLGAPPGFEPM
jgi:hypothetical protein